MTARLTPAEIEQIVDDAMSSCEDALGENPELGEDNIVWDIAKSVTYGLHPDDAKEIQHQLGVYL